MRKLRLTSAMQAEGQRGGGRGGLLYISAAVGGIFICLCAAEEATVVSCDKKGRN